MHIGKHEVGPGHPVYICAEGGASHNGSVHKAILQMRLAHDAGATAFKLQKRTLPDAIPESQRDVMKDSPWGTLDYVAYREKLEFGQPEYGQLFDVAAKVGIDFFVSVHICVSVSSC
jgi:N-acetylneuraminate synthase